MLSKLSTFWVLSLMLLYIATAMPTVYLPNQTSTLSNDTTPGASDFGLGVKAAATVLGILAALLTTFTYATLIDAAARMTAVTKLPLGSIARNIGTVLGLAWPETSDS